MTQWEYKITLHELPELLREEKGTIIECDQKGQCFVHDTSGSGVGWLENLLCEKGRECWELVQTGYHNRELLCIWKKPIAAGERV